MNTVDYVPYKTDQGAVVEARSDDTSLEHVDTDEVVELLARAGFIVFRGFDTGLDSFSGFVRRFSSKVTLDPARSFHGGQVAQKVDAGTNALGLHVENGNSPFMPDLTWFLCERAAVSGSQTTVCDGVDVWRRARGTALERFAQNDIVYRRRVDEVKWKTFVNHHLDIPKPLEKIKVADIVRLANDASSTTITLDDDGSIEYAYRTRAAHGTLFDDRLAWANSILGPSYNYEAPRITDEAGNELDKETLSLIREVTSASTIDIDWRDGDVALIDNTRVMHGRRKITDPDRTIYNAQSYIRRELAGATGVAGARS